MIYRDEGHATNVVKGIILYCPSITQVIVESHYEIMWYENYGAGLGIHLTGNYAAGLDDADKQTIIAQQCLRYNIIYIWINNYLTTDANHKLRAFRYEYTLNIQMTEPQCSLLW